jgi:hypothetical protein
MMNPFCEEQRQATARRRVRPGVSTHLTIPFAGVEHIDPGPKGYPDELLLEVTDAKGEPASWFHDEWLTLLVQAWGECPLTVTIADTPEALLHPLVLHEMLMLRRMAPQWRLVGRGRFSAIQREEDIDQAGRTPYHVLRLVDDVTSIVAGPGRGAPPRDRADRDVDRAGHIPGARKSAASIVAGIRAAQAAAGLTTPIIVRVPTTAR